ncbi:MAG TPA: D-glycero-beta-D-manno-heptose 1-phosphate adenylyltransferase [Saprospiraceae bacterium]|mgnify:CR=1 FL=1|nr:D-glycero-beta-D-manno-heptose 1-phosphate adenylyltransferase [Saprospiraceae bacterium]HQW54986.1 D-glycero-beta-D-manno-heptose 1-phosphate adenylyltransferase [Saprospiraceae bacterium]
MYPNKIKEPEEANRIIQNWQDAGLEVVFTNGCFDLLHAGHVSYLHESRRLGDRLVIALNDDSSVSRLKGPTRPVNTLQDRAIVLSALQDVDLITWFSEDTPLELITLLLPDILTKGGDYEPDSIVGADIVCEAGGAVVSLPFVDGYSTTNFLNK